MTGLLSDKEIAELMPAEFCPYRTPVPTQMVSSDEYYPAPQNAQQREVESRLLAMADELGGRLVSTGAASSRQLQAWRPPF